MPRSKPSSANEYLAGEMVPRTVPTNSGAANVEPTETPRVLNRVASAAAGSRSFGGGFGLGLGR